MGKEKRKSSSSEKPEKKHHKKSKSSSSPEEHTTADVSVAFRTGLFDKKVRKSYHKQYKSSEPYVLRVRLSASSSSHSVAITMPSSNRS